MAENDKSSELLTAKEARQRLISQLAVSKAEQDITSGLGTNQPNPEEGVFTKDEMDRLDLLPPPYDPMKMLRVVENSTMLGTCIETYVKNIDGYGHEFRYMGSKENENIQEVVDEKQTLDNFFAKVNESQSFKNLRKELRFDYEATGNGYIEVVRFPTGKIATLYRADTRYIRLQKKQSKFQPVKVSFPRNGKNQTITVSKRFRKFAMIVNTVSSGQNERIRWFKEYGDPRRMDAITGRYEEELGKNEKIQEEANEIIHWKQGNDTYGIPRWAGILPVVLGTNKADYVNYDLFDSNAIPALAILVSGGRLTAESVDDLAQIIKGQQGLENWHKFPILEAVGMDTEGDVGDKPTSARVDFKELNKPEDAEFSTYIGNSEQRVRSKFRLPPIMTGQAENYSRSTADSSKLVSEEQVFIPERNSFDEMIDFTLLKELGAKYHRFHSLGPKMMEGSDQIDAYGKLARGGALSVNEGVRIANRVLDLDMTQYSGQWAELPIAIVLELLKRGYVTGVDGLGAGTSDEGNNDDNNNNDDDSQKSIVSSQDTIKLEDVSEDITELKDQLETIYDMLSKMDVPLEPR